MRSIKKFFAWIGGTILTLVVLLALSMMAIIVLLIQLVFRMS